MILQFFVLAILGLSLSDALSIKQRTVHKQRMHQAPMSSEQLMRHDWVDLLEDQKKPNDLDDLEEES